MNQLNETYSENEDNEIQEGNSSEDESQIEMAKINLLNELNESEAKKISVQRLNVNQESNQTDIDLINIELRAQNLVKSAEQYAQFLIQRFHGNGEDDNDDEVSAQTTQLTQQPSILKGGQLKDYQLNGLNWLISLYDFGMNGILADEMGLGKTIQIIAFIAFLRQYKGIRKHFLIVAPKSTLGNWMREFSIWFPKCKVVKLVAVMGEREEILKNYIKNGNFDVCITSFSGIQKCFSQLSKINYTYLIVDEAHALKNDESVNRRLLQQIKTRYKFFLTGTPLQNNPHELWSLLNFLFPNLFPDSDIFDEWFDIQQKVSEQNSNADHLNQKNIELVNHFQRILRLFMLRRTKAEVLSSLPPKKEIHLYMQLTPLQIELYKKVLLDEELVQGQKQSLNNKLMQLRKVCLHPYLFPQIEDKTLPEYGEHIIQNSGKLRFLDVFLKLLYEEKHQVLIFSQFTSVLDIIEDYCVLRDHKYCRLDGKTDMDSRDQQISEFVKPNSQKFLFLLSTRAGGLGINLTTADTVIIFDSDFNPQQDLQAMDRVHRIGQNNPVNVYRLVCKNTVEEKIIERQQVKLRWEKILLQQGVRQQGAQKIVSKDDIKQIIMFGAHQIFTTRDEWDISNVKDIIQEGEKLTNQLNERINEQMGIIEQNTNNTLELGLKQINIYDYFQGNNEKDKLFLELKKQNKQSKQQQNEMGSLRNKKQLLPFLDDFISNEDIQYYCLYKNDDLLYELQNKQNRYLKYLELQEQKIPFQLPDNIQPDPLSVEENQQLQNIYEEGFPQMTEELFQQILLACDKYGPKNISDIAIMTKQNENFIKSYIDALVSRGLDNKTLLKKIKKIDQYKSIATQNQTEQNPQIRCQSLLRLLKQESDHFQESQALKDQKRLERQQKRIEMQQKKQNQNESQKKNQTEQNQIQEEASLQRQIFLKIQAKNRKQKQLSQSQSKLQQQENI